MKFSDPRLMILEDQIQEVARELSLDPDHLVVESFIPNSAAVFVETVGEHQFRLHVNLQEHRIVSVKELGCDRLDRAILQKYIAHMR